MGGRIIDEVFFPISGFDAIRWRVIDMQKEKQLRPEEAAYEISEMWSDEWFSPEDTDRIKSIAGNIPEGVQSLLDAGCGNGMFLHYLRENETSIERLCGVERSRAALSLVKGEKFEASIEEMPFDANEFDLVSCLEVLEHLPVSTFDSALSELCRVAREYIIITVPFDQDLTVGMTVCPSCSCRFNADYHVRSFREKTLSRLFDGRGFECMEVFKIGPRRIMHRQVAKCIDCLRLIKHRLNGFGQTYPSYAVCPSCGFRDKSKSIGTSQNSGTVSSSLVQRISLKHSHRWVGAIYKKADTGVR